MSRPCLRRLAARGRLPTVTGSCQDLDSRDGEKSPTRIKGSPLVFMYHCTAGGVDDSPRQGVLPIDRHMPEAAEEEIETVLDMYQRFRAGEPALYRGSLGYHLVKTAVNRLAVAHAEELRLYAITARQDLSDESANWSNVPSLC